MRSLRSISELETLNLSGNNLTGTVPEDIIRLGNFTTLNLSHNKFSGEIPNGLSDLSSLVVLNLSACGFSGRIPANIGSLMKLTSLDLSKQQLSGELPIELFGLSSLHVVALEENRLSGDVPEGFSSLAGLLCLNLSANEFTGRIPSTYGFLQSLVVFSLSDNRVSGRKPVELGNCSDLEVLQLRSNQLKGNPPDGNQLSGNIPVSLSKLSNLTSLDLSSNRLSGDIPLSFPNMSSLKYLNLSRNNLEGECANVRKRKQRKLILLIAMVVGGACIFAVFCCGYIYSLIRWWQKLRGWATSEKKRSPARVSSGPDQSHGSGENGGPKLVMFNNKITLVETLEATRQFDEENVLSRGRYGLVFKATFQDGMVLSICRLVDGSIEEATFRKEAELLGKVKHRNITVLRGYYAGPPDLRLLVYDYMPNGNLATLLQEASHQEGHMLNWPMLHLIALGIARGLAFLHSLSIVHGDVNPQNALFDADFEAHLSEFRLEKLIIATPAEASSSSTPVGSLGYVAPEVVLTELTEPGLFELDPKSSEWEEFLLGVKVGLLCSAPEPVDRPAMADIVFMLEGCRVGQEIPSSADPTTSLPSPV
ncbi:putative LRR receptor-like serine/threonine-protein kinase [Hibiscus syriacus]|uniref:LRR receptor-like serine/threonine-protein kinase n=1 Tax=Hibiscus syriacus TaxID=106335 RepID=A0A6A3CIR1_HIBSY|nr:putative LRR receptor-like serine/threonine-protein kinase [Hibiscus syriacus]